jgi:hypothetical protein
MFAISREPSNVFKTGQAQNITYLELLALVTIPICILGIGVIISSALGTHVLKRKHYESV